jgi:thioester reductase-like protein
MNLLLTGATGALGAELLRRLLQERPACGVFVLLRAESPEAFRLRADALHAGLDPADARRVIPLAGDVALPELGLGRAYLHLADRVTEIYHAAACTRFDAPAEYSARHNIAGTKSVLDLARAARRAGHSGRVHYVSTAYVSGRRRGCVTEDELECGQGFFNAYEWSKFEAERAVRAAGHDLPVTIYRPSVLVGHSRTGRAERFLGIYQVLRWIHRGLVRTLPCRRDFLLDLAPADYVAEAIVRLASVPGSVGKTFHLTAGSGNALAVEELLTIFLSERQACRDRVPATRLLPLQFARGDISAEPRDNRWRSYHPYLTCPKVFDDGNTRAMLEGVRVPPCREFFPRVARYALDSGFRQGAT